MPIQYLDDSPLQTGKIEYLDGPEPIAEVRPLSAPELSAMPTVGGELSPEYMRGLRDNRLRTLETDRQSRGFMAAGHALLAPMSTWEEAERQYRAGAPVGGLLKDLQGIGQTLAAPVVAPASALGAMYPSARLNLGELLTNPLPTIINGRLVGAFSEPTKTVDRTGNTLQDVFNQAVESGRGFLNDLGKPEMLALIGAGKLPLGSAGKMAHAGFGLEMGTGAVEAAGEAGASLADRDYLGATDAAVRGLGSGMFAVGIGRGMTAKPSSGRIQYLDTEPMTLADPRSSVTEYDIASTTAQGINRTGGLPQYEGEGAAANPPPIAPESPRLSRAASTVEALSRRENAPEPPTSQSPPTEFPSEAGKTETPAETPQTITGSKVQTGTEMPVQTEAPHPSLAEKPAVKEPWEMTLAESLGKSEIDNYQNRDRNSEVGQAHQKAVEQAIADGKPVPENVLNDYPWLKAERDIGPYVESLKAMTDNELKAEEKASREALNKWVNSTPAILPDGTINPNLHGQEGFVASAKFNAVNRELDARQNAPQASAQSSNRGATLSEKNPSGSLTIYTKEGKTIQGEWNTTRKGDIVGSDSMGYYEVVDRHVRPKRDARKLAEQVGGNVWIDGKNDWAVMKPADKPVLSESQESSAPKPVLSRAKATPKAEIKPEPKNPVSKTAQRDGLLAQVQQAIESAPTVTEMLKAYSVQQGRDVWHVTVKENGRRIKREATDLSHLSRSDADALPKIEFDVPGDGTFKIVNSKESLAAFANQVQRKWTAALGPDRPEGRSPGIPLGKLNEAFRTTDEAAANAFLESLEKADKTTTEVSARHNAMIRKEGAEYVVYSAKGKGVAYKKGAVEAFPEPKLTGKRSAAALGAVAPGTAEFIKTLEFLARKADPKAIAVDPDVVHPLPDLDYTAAKTIGLRPQGTGRIPLGIGRLFDPRQSARTPDMEAFVAHANLLQEGDAHVSVIQRTLEGMPDPFTKAKDGRITNVKAAEGAPLHLADMMERWMQDRQEGRPSPYRFTPEQERWVRVAWQLVVAARKLGEKHNLKGADTSPEIPALAGAGVKWTFPRPVVDKIDPTTGERMNARAETGGGYLSKRQPFEKERLYGSEAQGSQTTLYEPDGNRRVLSYLRQTYKAIADDMLVNDPALGGMAPLDRLPLIAERYRAQLLAGEMTPKDIEQLAYHPFLGVEGMVYEPAFWQQIFPVEIAQRLNKAFRDESHWALRGVRDINAMTKTLVYGFDQSFLGIQLQLLALDRPTIAAKAALANFSQMIDPQWMSEYFKQPGNLKAAREMARFGTQFARSQDVMVGAGEGELIHKIPVLGTKVLGPVADVLSRGYMAAMDVARLELWKAMRDRYPREEWPAVAEQIDNMVLRGRRKGIGVHAGQTLLEDVFLSAASMYRAGANVVASAFFDKGAAGKMSRVALAKWVFGAHALFIGISKMLGTDDDEIKRRLNPMSSTWLMVPVPTGDGKVVNVGFGGTIRSILKLIYTTGATAIQRPQDFSTLNPERNPLTRWVRGHMAPGSSAAVNLFLGRDYLGNKTDAVKAVRSLLTPLVIENLVPSENTDDQGGLAQFAPGVAGLTTFGDSYRARFTRRLGEMSRKQYNTSYDKLGWRQQFALQRQLSSDQTMGTKPPPTARQQENAFVASEERVNRLTRALPSNVQASIKADNLHVPGYDPVLTPYAGRKFVLTSDQQERFERLVSEQYAKILPRTVESFSWRRSSGPRRQKLLNDAAARARQIAERQFLNERR